LCLVCCDDRGEQGHHGTVNHPPSQARPPQQPHHG
jgi:hypothetical protein